MTDQPDRLGEGGRIDRSRPFSFSFDGRAYTGWSRDTLASALLANGVRLVGRSFKYHRPRGVYAAGVEEPNALVTLRKDGRHEPNVSATTVELFDGLVAESQNRWPSLGLDILGAIDRLPPVFAAGFYYKTFLGPTRGAWMFYERFIRRAGGMGKPPSEPDPDRYEKAHAFCDVLVVGGGPSGLAATLAAGRGGVRVVLVEQEPVLGGSLLARPRGGESDAWLAAAIDELAALPNVRVMTRTTAFGAYDNLVFGLAERVNDHLAEPPPRQPRQRYWVLRARRAVLASGMIERPIVFGNNDLPGVMLASAARCYLNRYAALAGRTVVAFTNNDSAYDGALELAAAGADVSIVDVRRQISDELEREARDAGISLLLGHAVAGANGRRAVDSVDVIEFDPASPTAGAVKSRLPCDLVAVSGGWTPTLHLLAQRGSKPVFDKTLAMLVPGVVPEGYRVVGGAAADDPPLAGLPPERRLTGIAPVWAVADPLGAGRRKKFVDLQNDVTLDDISLAHLEGYEAIEHLKRYTSLGMGSDQGKTSNLNALAILAGVRGRPVGTVGTTTYRPPYTPVSIGALGGAETGQHFKPVRRTPMHDWHQGNGAVFTDAGLWQRPWYYPKAGESLDAAYVREAGKVRDGVGMVDISSLGKIDIQGPDGADFLDRVYVNNWRSLPVGKARYGVMLRADGIALDDGTTSRISENHYFMTTTTANAGTVMTHLEFLLQAAWPELKVQVTSVTGQWAGIAVAGPRSRDLLARLVVDLDLDDDAFPFMGVRHGHAGKIPVRMLRISFSGELAYEVYTPADYGEELWQAVHDQSRAFGLVIYGTEALGALRIEKGHVAGPEIDGRTTLSDLGLERMASKKKPYLGGALMEREGLAEADRRRLVGLEPTDRGTKLRAGAVLCQPGRHQGHGIGVVTSVTYSPALGGNIGIGLLAGGMSREGQVIDAVFPLLGEVVAVRVRSPHFVDPKGERLHA